MIPFYLALSGLVSVLPVVLGLGGCGGLLMVLLLAASVCSEVACEWFSEVASYLLSLVAWGMPSGK